MFLTVFWNLHSFSFEVSELEDKLKMSEREKRAKSKSAVLPPTNFCTKNVRKRGEQGKRNASHRSGERIWCRGEE